MPKETSSASTTEDAPDSPVTGISSPPLPPLHPNPGGFRNDVLAGITCGIISLPQALAFPLIAGVDPIYGLYTMIIPTIVSCIIQKNAFPSFGSTNTSALVAGMLLTAGCFTFSATNGPANADDRFAMMLCLVFLMGVFQIAFGILKLGNLGRYVSQGVLQGFTLGAAAIIAGGQIKTILDITIPPDVQIPNHLLGTLGVTAQYAGTANLQSVGIAAGCFALMLLCSWIHRLIPGPMIAVIAAGIAVFVLGWGPDTTGDPATSAVATIGNVPNSLPTPELPPIQLNMFTDSTLLTGAAAIALLGIVETISMGKAVTARAGLNFSPNRELIALGAANLAGSCTQCMPAAPSWTRSATNQQLGSKSPLAGIAAAIFVLSVMLIFARYAMYVPKAALGAVIFFIAVRMVDPQKIKFVWRWGKTDASILVFTFICMMVIPVQYAIYLGVALSLVMLVRRADQLHLVEMVQTEDRKFREQDIDDQTGKHPAVLLQLEGDLFFGLVDAFEKKLQEVSDRGAKAIVIRLKRAHALDATVAESLALFTEHFKARNGIIIFCGLRQEMYDRIKRSRLGNAMGEDNLFLTQEGAPYESVLNALGKARNHIQEVGAAKSGDVILRSSSDTLEDAWFYSI